MSQPKRGDPRIARITADIQKHGWHVVKVMADESGPAFAYSIGLWKTFGHPEILLFGFEPDLMHRIINNVGSDVRNGKQFRAEQQDDDVLNNYAVQFKPVLPQFLDELAGMALAYYGGPNFTLLQCVLPDKQHRFPWDAGYDEWLRENQWTFFGQRAGIADHGKGSNRP